MAEALSADDLTSKASARAMRLYGWIGSGVVDGNLEEGWTGWG